MIRDNVCGKEFWDEWVAFQVADIKKMQQRIKETPGDPTYRPQYLFELAKEYWHLIFLCYSRGDSIAELKQYIPPLLDAWEISDRLYLEFKTVKELQERRNWIANLDHYIVCFWLVGLALSLNIPDDQWQRLLALIGNEGEDALLDRVIASRQPDRQIGNKLCHPKPYQRLLDTINAPKNKQAKLLFTFVDKWYSELNRPPKKGLSEDTAMYERPYWYKYHTLEGGYFGYWCVEAVAAVRAFDLDDSLCLGHPNYPGDLLRPDAPSTHVKKAGDTLTSNQVSDKPGLLSRLFGRK